MTPTVIGRRRALRFVGAAMLSGVAGSLLSATRTRTFAQADGAALAVFTQVSGVLTGKSGFDLALAMGLYQALRQTTPDFDAGLVALKVSLAQGAGADGVLAFDDEHKPQGALAQAILQAWYLGVAGKGAKAQCVAYIETLSNRAVAAELVPPSYSYGACGSWQARP